MIFERKIGEIELETNRWIFSNLLHSFECAVHLTPEWAHFKHWMKHYKMSELKSQNQEIPSWNQLRRALASALIRLHFLL